MTIEEEFEKNPELKNEDLKELREWLSKQRYLPNVTDLELILFLHAKQFDVQAAKVMLNEHYTVRTHLPNIFGNRDLTDKQLARALEVVSFASIPSANGERVIISRLRDVEPARYSLVNAIRAFFLVQDLDHLRNGTAKGHRIVFDMTGMVMGHLTRMSPVVLHKFIYYLQEVFPGRLRGIHYINIVPYVDVLMSLMRPFIKKQLLEILHFHKELDLLYKYIPRKYLPRNYGGEGPSMNEFHEITLTDLYKHKSVFAEEEQTRRVNERIRPGGPKDATDLFGIESSFKQLEID
ncbi:alpha-tocopherol transfer protein-like [Ctenocephalides felis]|uniref:alpha-tocopherol transfer protein-like n=1 Tax=Ctenocephalides felis TaxID=7515 RepID=UPI000E6E4679|nr:alpha-tocopherol transfer protein-like [Ctenocephalides felis]